MKERLFDWVIKEERTRYADDRLRMSREKAAMHALRRRLHPKETACAGSESAQHALPSPGSLARWLSRFDVVCFDVFDTLLVRSVDEPAALFYLLADQLNVPDLRRLRIEAEHRLRRRHGEVTLAQIWAELQDACGVDAEEGMAAEWALEQQVCAGRAYMQALVWHLSRSDTRMIAVSDMYLSSAQIMTLLKMNGFAALQECHVSAERGLSKAKGDIYPWLRARYGRGCSLVMVGDDPIADHDHALRAGLAAVQLPNVNRCGAPFRARQMSPVCGAFYRGIVNAALHDGIRQLPEAYELGFVYGSLLALGYCQHIHRYVHAHGIERVLFLSRDGDILHQVYGMLYPQERARCSYVYWSRLAAAKLMAGRWKHDYFRRFLYHKADGTLPLCDVFASMELEDMTAACARSLGVMPDALLDRQLAQQAEAYLRGHMDEVLRHYAQQDEAARKYYRRILDGARLAAAVDVGWAGSGALALRALMRKWEIPCEIRGLLAGTNTVHNADADAVEGQLFTGTLDSYVFSAAHNRELWRGHDLRRMHNVIVEVLLSSPEPGFRGFMLDAADEPQPQFKPQTGDPRARALIQRGILDFAALYVKRVPQGAQRAISGADAYAPVSLLKRTRNRPVMERALRLMDELQL